MDHRQSLPPSLPPSLYAAGERVRTELIALFLQRLYGLRDALNSPELQPYRYASIRLGSYSILQLLCMTWLWWRFWSSSLLLIYEGHTEVPLVARAEHDGARYSPTGITDSTPITLQLRCSGDGRGA